MLKETQFPDAHCEGLNHHVYTSGRSKTTTDSYSNSANPPENLGTSTHPVPYFPGIPKDPQIKLLSAPKNPTAAFQDT